MIYIKNWFLRFDRYISYCKSVYRSKFFGTVVTSWLNSQHLASPNISATAQEPFKTWNNWWWPWHNCIWMQIKTLYVVFTFYLQVLKFHFHHSHGHDHMITWPSPYQLLMGNPNVLGFIFQACTVAIKSTVKCRYNAVQYITLLHTALR